MKKVFLSMFLLASMTLSVVAQQAKGGRKAYNIEEVKALNLTDSQKTAIKELKKTYLEESRKRAEAHQEAIKAILTPEQAVQWDKSMEKRKSQRGDRRNDTRPAQTIKYNEATTTQIAALNNDLEKELKAIRMSRLSPEEQDRRIKEVHEKYSALRSKAVEENMTAGAAGALGTTDMVAVNPIAPMIQFDQITTSKLEALDAELTQQREAINLSRIAPEMQQRKIQILEENTRAIAEKVLASDPNVIQNGGEVPGTTLKLSAKTLKKLDTLNKEYQQAEKAIRMTRIAPEMQQQRIKDLNATYANKRIDIVEADIK